MKKVLKEEQKQHLIDMIKGDEELGLYQEPKQETTLEEAAEKLYPVNNTGDMFMANRDEINNSLKQEGFIAGAKWQQERMYSEEEVKQIDKKHLLAEFIIRVVRNAQANPTKSISDVIKETKKEFD